MSVNFRTDREVYYPGDTVRGNVTYQVTKQRNIKQANLIFTGVLRAEYIPTQQNNTMVIIQGPRRPSKETYILFQHELKLFEGPYDVPPQKFDWPFEFDLPRSFNLTRRDGGEAVGMGNNEVSFGLPPTYAWLDMTIGRQVSANISYKLVFKSENSGMFSNDEQEQTIILRQYGDSSRQQSSLKPTRHEMPKATWSSDKLRPAERRLSFKQKMKSTFSSDPELKSPTLAFSTCLYLPQAIVIDQTFGISLSLEQQKEGENDPNKPTLVLDRLTLRLKSHTTVFTQSKSLFHSDAMRCQGELALGSHDVSLPGGGVDLVLGGQLVDIPANLRLLDWLSSEHRSLNGDFDAGVVKLEYRLAVELTIRHVETGKDFRLAVQVPVGVLNSAATGQDAKEGSSQGAGARNIHDLPAYEANDRPPGVGPPAFDEGSHVK